jgi:hypothetical protein
VIRHGVVANDQGELFRIDVFGQDDEFVLTYFRDLRLCLDAVPTDQPAEQSEEGVPVEQDRPEGEFGPEDLVIQIALLGLVDPAEAPGLAEELAPTQADDWEGTLARRGASPDLARPEFGANGYIIDAVIDPEMQQSVTHHYREILTTKVLGQVTVSGGGVRAGLCRNSWSPLRGATVAAGLSAGLSDTQTRSYVYDLGVIGLSGSNRYMLSTSWWVPGWSSGYWASAPTGSQRYCIP